MNYKELEKLYAVKIPIAAHADYYLDTLQKSAQYREIPHWIKMLQELESEMGNVTDYKFKQMDRLIAELKPHLEKVNAFEQKAEDFQAKSFQPASDRTYLSFDIREANWTAFKHMADLLDLPTFSQWLALKSLHPFVSESKTFRQQIFGNLNPKRLQRWQMNKMATFSQALSACGFLVDSLASDEAIVDISSESQATLRSKLESLDLDLMRVKKFKVDMMENFGERVRVDSIYKGEIVVDHNVDHKRLSTVNGNRFFLHFKTLIINEPLDDRDLLFKLDGNIAKWVI